MYQPEQLDWRYSTDCPRCSGNAGWTGGTAMHRDLFCLELSCVECGYLFIHFSGRWVQDFRQDPKPAFKAGSDMPG